MPRYVISSLTARRVLTECTPGMYGDGGGLYLQVTESGARTWIFRFQIQGRRRDMGLGSASPTTDGQPVVSLAEARDRAATAKRLVANGVDPIEQRKEQRKAAARAAAKAMTFRECAGSYMEAQRAGWRNEKHAAQWETTLETYVYPTLGDLSVSSIEPSHVRKVLAPIWRDKTETASRIRGRIESVLEFAKALGGREGDNPARWAGNLEHMFPAKGDIRTVQHHASMPYPEVPDFWTRLAMNEGAGAQALAFAILTACRTGEVLGARWDDEIDLADKVWTIPAERMKGKREHRVPLSDPAVAMLRKLDAARMGEFVFPNQSGAKLSDMTMHMALRRMKVAATPHGFRASFRTWIAEETDFPPDLAEAALAHTQGALHDAYQRGDLLAKRRVMMTAWADYVERRNSC